MRRKRVLDVLIIVIVFAMLVSSSALAYIPPGVTNSNLYASYVTQQKSNWCWVACAQNATIQEGCNLYDQYFAVYVLKGYTPNFYPDVTGTISDTEAAAEIMCDHSLNYVTAGVKTFSFLSDKIYNGHSVIAGYTYTYNGNTYGHMVLLMGWDTSTGINKLKYYDPGDGLYHIVTYAAFCSGMYNNSEYFCSCYVN